SSTVFRTTMQCTGQRHNGELFLAGVWFSTYRTVSGTRVAAIIVDLSEDLRSREDLSLDYLLKKSRILMSAAAHEVRNLCGAVLVVYKDLKSTRLNSSHVSISYAVFCLKKKIKSYLSS